MDGKSSSPAVSIIARFGGQSAMARALGISQGTVWGWANAGRIPYDRIPAVVEAGRRAEPAIALTAEDFVAIPPPEAPSRTEAA